MAEFLESDSNLHVMRDHPAHGAFVMGGLWGAKVVNMRKDLILAFKDMFAVRTFNIVLKLFRRLTPPVSHIRMACHISRKRMASGTISTYSHVTSGIGQSVKLWLMTGNNEKTIVS